MATDVIERLRYYQRQYLSVVDFADEQAYHRDMRRRHNVGLHTWGVVAGLELDERGPAQGALGPIQIAIRPGLAIDGYGREIVLLQTIELPPDPRLFAGLTTSAYVPVWIAYDEERQRRPAPGYEQCEDEVDQFGRVRERFRLLVGPRDDLRDAIVVDGQQVDPPAIPADESVPYQELRGDPPPTWLIRLGSVNWDGPHQEFGANDPERLVEDRRYVGAIAAIVYGPAGIVRIAPRFAPPAPAAGQRAAPVAETDGPLHVLDYLRVDDDALVGGRLGVKTDDPRNPVGIRGTGTWEELLSFEAADGTTKWHVNQLFAGTTSGLNVAETGVADARLFIKAGGNVGIGTGNPTNRLHVDDATGIRQGRLYLSGGPGNNGWSSLTFNAYHNAANSAWVFPDNTRPAGTIEMDAAPGSGGRFEVYGTTVGSTQNWVKRLRIDLESGDIQLAPSGGRVGVGSVSPRNPLAVRGTGSWQELLSFEATDGTTKWHLNQLFNGTDPGLNFAETAVADARLFLRAGGNVGVGIGTPTERLDVNGNLRVRGNLIVDGGMPLVKVLTYTRSLRNTSNPPQNWTINHAGDFQQVYRKFVVFQGFSIWPHDNNINWWSTGGGNAVGHAFVRLEDNNDLNVNSTSGYCFVNEVGPGAVFDDNAVLFTLVIIGR